MPMATQGPIPFPAPNRFRQLLSWMNRGPVLRGREPIPISSIIVPYRYDVITRVDFFRVLQAHFHLVDQDPGMLHETCLKHHYYLWFKHAFFSRKYPMGYTEDLLDREFRNRVRRNVALLESFATGGFDERFPLTLRRGIVTVRSLTGSRVPSRQPFLGDGCHRLALLILLGQRDLQPSQYEVQLYGRYRPLDITLELLPHLGLTERDFASFLGADVGGCSAVEQFIESIRSEPRRALKEWRAFLSSAQEHLR